MAHAYTPGLRVTAFTVLHKTRRLPLQGDVVVEAGAPVAAEDVVARTALPGNVKTVNVANVLGIPPADVPGAMRVAVGTSVTEGQVLAESKSLFGLMKSKAVASTTGVVENVSEITGQVTLREAALPVELSAYVDGRVAEVVFTPLFMRFWFLEYYEDFKLPAGPAFARVAQWRAACLEHPAAQPRQRPRLQAR